MIFNMTKPVLETLPQFTYTGTYELIDDGGGNWRIKFLTSGILTPLKDMLVDVFLVGAGGGGAACGGGGGYTVTSKAIALKKGTEYYIEIGSAGIGSHATSASTPGNDGGNTNAFNLTAEGGKGGKGGTDRWEGGDGGSGGGAYNASGGVDGANGGNNPDVSSYKGGTGQGTTTREFGESTGDLYSSGGSGILDGASAGADNTGNGGDNQQDGGSGIAIIRNHREDAA